MALLRQGGNFQRWNLVGMRRSLGGLFLEFYPVLGPFFCVSFLDTMGHQLCFFTACYHETLEWAAMERKLWNSEPNQIFPLFKLFVSGICHSRGNLNTRPSDRTNKQKSWCELPPPPQALSIPRFRLLISYWEPTCRTTNWKFRVYSRIPSLSRCNSDLRTDHSAPISQVPCLWGGKSNTLSLLRCLCNKWVVVFGHWRDEQQEHTARAEHTSVVLILILTNKEPAANRSKCNPLLPFLLLTLRHWFC